MTTSLLVTAAAGSAGQAVAIATATQSVALNASDGQPFEYQVGTGSWHPVTFGSGVSIPVDLSATTLKLRRVVWGGQATVQIDTREAVATGGGGTAATTFSALTDKTTVDLVATNGPLAASLAAKATLQVGALAASTVAAPNATAVQNAIAALVNSAPGVLDTLNELAAALANDPNFATTMTTALAGKADAAATTAALAAKTPLNADVQLTGANTLTAAAHAFRNVTFTGAGAVQTMGAGAEGAVVEVSHNGTGTLTFANASAPTGYRLTLSPGETGQVKYTGGAWQSLIPSLASAAAAAVTKLVGEVSYFAWVTATAGTFLEPNNAIGNGMLDSSVAGTVPWAATNRYTVLAKIMATGAAAAVSRLAGRRAVTPSAVASPWFAPAPGVEYGWKFRMLGGIGDANAAGQFGMGFFAALPAWTNVIEPSAALNAIFLGGDSGDAQLSVMCNDGSGACTKIALNGGVGFPNNTNAADFYALDIEWRSDGTADTLTYRAENLITKIVATGTISANKPVAGTPFTFAWCRGSANTATIPVVHQGGFACGDALR